MSQYFYNTLSWMQGHACTHTHTHCINKMSGHAYTNPSEKSVSKLRSAPRFRADHGDVSTWTIACLAVGEAITRCWTKQCF